MSVNEELTNITISLSQNDTIALAIVLVLSFFLSIYWRVCLSKLKKKFSKIIDAELESNKIITNAKIEREKLLIDVELEREKIINETKKIKYEFEKLEREFKENKASLEMKYSNAVNKYTKLIQDLNLLEESFEMTEFGFYKPHFNFSDPEEYKKQLEILRENEKRLIREERAVTCSTTWTVEGSKTEGKRMTKQTHKLMLRAFNGECDAALAKVRWDNITKMEQRIIKSVEIINKSAQVNKSYITQEYLNLKLKELRLTYELQEKIKDQKDEQRRIQQEIKEEEKVQKEMIRAKIELEKEEQMYEKALQKARSELLKANEFEIDRLNETIQSLEISLKKANEKKERVISQAQLTKSGFVYVISNIGSFGENMYKIGMSRRLEPEDRVRELSGASVPFEFDIHAMIYSEDAPKLEKRLHNLFAEKRVNLVNPRKEFFNVSLLEIEELAKKENIVVNFTKIAEARSFRESKAIRERGEAKKIALQLEENYLDASKLFDDD